MANLAELEKRIGALEDIESIKQLKYRYFRHLDSLNWEGVADCFADDAVIDYEPGIRMEGKEDIRKHVKDRLLEHIGVHQGHHPEIAITSPATATGKLELFVYHYLPVMKKGFRLGGFYDDEYVKTSEGWRIRRSRMSLIFFEMWDREPLKRM